MMGMALSPDSKWLVSASAAQGKARQELAVAFAYIDRVSMRTSKHIQSEVGGEMSRAMADPILESINEQKIL